jgi:hypothetical protein
MVAAMILGLAAESVHAQLYRCQNGSPIVYSETP